MGVWYRSISVGIRVEHRCAGRLERTGKDAWGLRLYDISSNLCDGTGKDRWTRRWERDDEGMYYYLLLEQSRAALLRTHDARRITYEEM